MLSAPVVTPAHVAIARSFPTSLSYRDWLPSMKRDYDAFMVEQDPTCLRLLLANRAPLTMATDRSVSTNSSELSSRELRARGQTWEAMTDSTSPDGSSLT